MKRKTWVWTIAVGINFVLLSMGMFRVGVPPAEGNDEVVFATIDDLSGPYSFDGDENVKATALALEEVNYKVIGKKIRHTTRDTQLKPEVGVRRFREAVEQEHPVYVSAGASSAVSLAMQKVSGETKTLFWFHGYADALTQAGTVNRYSFRWSATDYAIANSVAASFVKKFPNAKTFSAITMDYVWGHSTFNECKAVIEKSGGKILENVVTPMGEADYTGAVTKALAANPDVLMLVLYGTPQIKGARTAHEFGAKKRAMVFIPVAGLSMLRGIGAEAVEGMYTGHSWWHRLDTKFSKEFTSKFRTKYGKIPSWYAMSHYMGTWLTLKAMERCKSTDVNKVICALEGYRYDGPTGKEEIRAFDHEVIHPLYLGKGRKLSEKEYEDDYVEIINSATIYKTYEQNPVVWDLKLPCDKK